MRRVAEIVLSASIRIVAFAAGMRASF